MKRLLFVICICLLLSLSGCFFYVPPPSLRAVNKAYSENKEDIDTVVNYMINAEYDKMIISDTSGTMSVFSYQWSTTYFRDMEISDQATQATVQRLIDQDIVKSFYKSDGEIEIRIWSRKEVNCYIACSIEGTMPCVQYATEVITMDEDGWYYVIADYNEWRVRQREAGITRPSIVQN